MAVNFLWSDVPLLSVPAKNILGTLLLLSTQEVLVWLLFGGYVSWLSLKPDDQVEMNIASLYGVEKKTRSVFFDIPFEVEHSLVSLPALVADGVFVDFLLGANWLKAVGVCLDVG